MRVYVDQVSGDEMFTDSSKFELVDEVAYEVEGKYVIVSNKIDDRLLGANPSAEDKAEELEEGCERVIDIIHGMRLTKWELTKKDYVGYIKDYVQTIKKRLEESDPERAAVFQKNVSQYIKKILENFKDYDTYVSEHWEGTGWVVLMNFRKETDTPYFVYLKDGLKEVKY
ncbi:Translationally controlled tumor-associated [Fasciola gigantica]|uniref:Translationally controlled tumor-associated n=1 Tax=Fasciola gigantica TaxID=46835 RepID=A0A504Y9U6_FASGI|nr:Translationally controlled tumor-associated [Fasciola gigantica]